MSRLCALVLAGLVLTGCGTDEGALQVDVPPARTTTPPPATPSPTPEVRGSRPAGLVITATADRPNARVGETVVLTVRVRNTTRSRAFVGPACIDLTQGFGTVPPTALTGTLRAFWDAATRGELQATVPFGPQRCTKVTNPGAIEPGATRTGTLRWTATSVNGSAYDGEVDLRTTSTYTVGTGADELIGFYSTDRLPLRLTGGDPAKIGPARALEVALAVPEIAAAVEASTVPPGGDAVSYEVDPATKRASFVVRVVANGTTNQGSGALVHVDAATGTAGAVSGWSSTY